MNMVTLKAAERSEKPKLLRNTGFIPGVLNGPGTDSTPVKFQTVALNKIILKHGTNAKVWVELGAEKKFGYLQEIQRHPVDGKVIHASIQLVATDQEIKMQLPINYHGVAELERQFLQVQTCKAEVEATGQAVLMPDVIIVDVTAKVSGDNVTAADFDLPKEITILDPEDEIYAIIKDVKEEVAETTVVTETAETAEQAE